MTVVQRVGAHPLLFPVLLLVAYALAVGLYTFRRDTRVGEWSVEQRTVKQVTLQMTQLQATLESGLIAGQLAAIREQVAGLGSNPDLEVGLLMDDQQQVLASTRLALIGRPAVEAWPELSGPEHIERMQRARKHMAGLVEVTADRQRVVGYYPVSLELDIPSARVGFLFLQHDLTALKAANRHHVEWSVIRASVLLLLVALAMGLLFHFALGRRLQQLAVDVRRRVGGGPGERGEPRPVGALDNLGQAIDEMAEEIGRSRQRLEENEERFQTLIERAPDAVLIHQEGRLVFINPAGVSMLGYDRAEELQGRPLEELAPEEEERSISGVSSEEGRASEMEWLHRTGRTVLGEVVSFPIVFEGRPAMVAIVRDITERKAVQTRLRSADRMVSLGTLAAGVAHEINNPLSFMLSNLRFINDELRAMAEGGESMTGARAQEVREALEETLSGGDRVSEIVRDLKTFARGDEARRGPVEVHAVLDLCANIARSELRHRARLVKEYGSVPPVYANESRLGQVFLNLIVNAAQAIPEGGDVKAHEVRVTTSRDAEGWAVVAVKDTGVGISPENLGRLFDPFFTTKPAGVGTGLGLSICHGIVTGLGGRITVESEPGKGTTFRVFLPPTESVAR